MTDNRIFKLDERTASKIAAGEVVERPAMVVKELVENAIDAGATEVSVAIKKGGKALIKVSDNGSGIHYEDLPLVFERHATSKIRSIEDLYNTESLGFRGEALASICAVATVELITLRAGETIGRQVQAAGGKLHKTSEVGTTQGTTILVKDLFFNTPARLKFLKSDSVEARSITELMGYLALSHPEVMFKYTMDDKLIFHTQGKGSLANAIFSVFDQNMVKGLYEIKDSQGKLKLEGFISRFDYTKGSRAHQLVFVNGRYVKSDLVKEAIHMAYKPYMMHNRYPVCVLFLEMPPNEIDVNIHPAKTEIKFHDDGEIKQFIYSALKKAFNLYDHVPKVTFQEKEVFVMNTEPVPTREERLAMASADEPVKAGESPVSRTEDARPVPLSTHKSVPVSAPEIAPTHTPSVGSYVSTKTSPPKAFDFSQLTSFATATLESADVIMDAPMPLEDPNGQKLTIYDGLHYVGVFNHTYLIYEKAQSLYLIDQHAAHEKILFEQFMEAFDRGSIQSQLLMIPEVIALSKLEISRYEDVSQLLSDMGFVVDVFGDDGVVMREIPSMFSLSQGIELVQALFENAKEQVDDHLRHRIAEKACKAAIKAHDAIHTLEASALIDSLKGLKSPYTCPHGRPVIIQFSLQEIEKKFKRII